MTYPPKLIQFNESLLYHHQDPLSLGKIKSGIDLMGTMGKLRQGDDESYMSQLGVPIPTINSVHQLPLHKRYIKMEVYYCTCCSLDDLLIQ
jgi:hypothetical protein